MGRWGARGESKYSMYILYIIYIIYIILNHYLHFSPFLLSVPKKQIVVVSFVGRKDEIIGE